MAGEWTKFEDDLPDKREVLAIARATKLHPERVACKLMAVWAWARRNSTDGVLHGVSVDDIDKPAGQRGFGKAMAAAGVMWVTDTPDGLVFPNWERHNSNGAKARAVDARRKEDERKSGRRPNGFGHDSDNPRTRAEQSRAEPELLKTNTPERPEQTPESSAGIPALPALPGEPVNAGPLIRMGVDPKTAAPLAEKGVTAAHLETTIAGCRGDRRIRKTPMHAALGILAKQCGIEFTSRDKVNGDFVERVERIRRQKGINA